MPRKVAIVEVAQLSGGDSKDNFYDQAYRVTREVLDKAGLRRQDVGTVVSAASDVFHGGISCANAYYWEAVGAFLKNGTRQDGESLFALYYAAMRILTGQYDTALAISLCKGFVIFSKFIFNIFQVAVNFLLVEIIFFTVLSPELCTVTG